MSKATPGVIELLHGKLNAVKDEGWHGQKPIVEDQCKPLLRSLVGEYDAEDEKVRREEESKDAAEAAAQAVKDAKAEERKAMDDYDAGFMALQNCFSKGQMMHQLSSKYMINQHYWKIFIPVQLIVTLAALLAFFAAALDAQKNVEIAFWLSLIAGALGFGAAFLNTVDRYLDWRTQGELHKKAASVYGKIGSEMSFSLVKDDSNARDRLSTSLSGLNEFTKKLKNLNDSIGELQIPYQILQAFEHVEQMIHQQVRVLNIYYVQNVNKHVWPLWSSRTENDFIITSYTVLANEITNYSGGSCCCTSWPWVLPDPKDVATKAHKKITEELFGVHFRDVPGIMDALRIDYGQIANAAPAPAPAAPAADPEAPAVLPPAE